MSRSFLTIIALCAVLSAAACNSVTGPAANSGDNRTAGSGGRDRNPGTIASPDELAPPDGDNGGGGGDTKEETYVAPAPRLDPVEHTPIDG